MKLYTTSSNCVRAAKVALGAGAVRDVHFKVVKTDEVHRDVGDNHIIDPASYQFFAIDDAPAVPIVPEGFKPAKVKAAKAPKVAKEPKAAKAPKVVKAKAAKASAKAKGERKNSDGTVGHQPSSQRLLALASRVSGVTHEDAAARLDLEVHTVRSMFCRLEREYKFDKEKVNGKLVRSNPRKLTAAAREAAAENATHAAA